MVIKSFFIACISVLIAACHTTSGINAAFNINAASYLNPDINGKASPVVISVYELKTPVEFSQASYTQLNSNAAQVLGASLIDKQYFEIQPGISRNISQYVTPNARYLGIVAAYRNIDQASWKKVLTLPHNKNKVDINVNLESQALIAELQG